MYIESNPVENTGIRLVLLHPPTLIQDKIEYLFMIVEHIYDILTKVRSIGNWYNLVKMRKLAFGWKTRENGWSSQIESINKSSLICWGLQIWMQKKENV